MKFDFDQRIDRTQSISIKWSPELRQQMYGERDIIPMGIADMDFKTAPAVAEAVQRHIAPRPAHIVIVRVIDRRLDDHIVARLRIHFDCAHQRHIDAGRIDDPLRLHIPMVAALLPVRARL